MDDILRNAIVLIDPLVNPDGRERYVSSFRQRVGETPNPKSSRKSRKRKIRGVR